MHLGIKVCLNINLLNRFYFILFIGFVVENSMVVVGGCGLSSIWNGSFSVFSFSIFHVQFKGKTCSETCDEGFYGDCTQKCNCSNNATCSPETGQCFCTVGWKGRFSKKINKRNKTRYSVICLELSELKFNKTRLF